ncbi:hypothetical protein AMTRI_Chr02g219740 [Amborella trichopoda]|uniref:Pectinesterase n=1 Tax=Amborella trichopoda TaxID=13333 RepID=W1P6V5_AMBTC|nr:pectinesterase [Amborella trichopoda]ERN03321.1 hypothetical protein AMTR_s00003p00238240 [Amborella trichopoda]|eukprot:XP_006841646.1 pectinesterase [Amborella trichopoda]
MAKKWFLLILLLVSIIQAHGILPSFPAPDPETFSPLLPDPETSISLIDLACSKTINPEACFETIQTECIECSPIAILSSTARLTRNEVKKAMEFLSEFRAQSVDRREVIATKDCMELLDFTSEELSWSLSIMNNPNFSEETMLHRQGDVRAWLSAALGNQDTCIEGFEGTKGHVRDYIQGSLQQVSQLVSNMLAMVQRINDFSVVIPLNNATMEVSNESHGRLEEGNGEFPMWMSSEEQKGIFRKGAGGVRANVVVASDGSGNFRSITEAIRAAPDYRKQRYVIHVRAGVYRENVEVKKKKTNIMLVGDGKDVTVISGSRSFLQGWTTFHTATFAVSGRGFIARDITFENTAGPSMHQAVALRVDSDQSAFYHCAIKGYQDTLYAHSLRQFYRECDIYGTIDFIFGNGAAFFQNCRILARKPLYNQKISITAHGRKDPHQSTGFSIQNCIVEAASDLAPIVSSVPAYLGRPWKPYARTIYMESYLGSLIQPEGWLAWAGNFALNTLYYGEYRNYGPGAKLDGRVRWPGYHVLHGPTEANAFTVEHFIDGRSWLPSTGIAFTAGLTK